MDTYTLRSRRGRVMEAVLAVIMPPPLRFKAVWRLAREKKQLFAWKPIAPEGFIALGTVYTETGKYIYIYVYYITLCCMYSMILLLVLFYANVTSSILVLLRYWYWCTFNLP